MSRRGKPVAFQFYAQDWLSDPKVRALSARQRGIYIDLLALDFQEGGLDPSQPPGVWWRALGLAAEDLCTKNPYDEPKPPSGEDGGAFGGSTMEDLEYVMAEFFVECADGMLHNPKLQEVANEQAAWKRKRESLGKIAAFRGHSNAEAIQEFLDDEDEVVRSAAKSALAALSRGSPVGTQREPSALGTQRVPSTSPSPSPPPSQSPSPEEKNPEGAGKPRRGDPPEVEIIKDPWHPHPLPRELEDPTFFRAVEDWIAYRRETKLRAWRPITWKKQLASLAKIGPALAAEAIARSIKQGWQGIFPDRRSPSGRPPNALDRAIQEELHNGKP